MRSIILILCAAAMMTGCKPRNRDAEDGDETPSTRAASQSVSTSHGGEVVSASAKTSPRWFGVGDVVNLNGAELELNWVGRSDDVRGAHAEILWVAHTKDETRVFQSPGWGYDVSMKDDFGNTYPRRQVLLDDATATGSYFGITRISDEYKFHASFGPPDSPTLTAQRMRWGALYFDLPIPAAKECYLVLSGRGLGVSGEYRFKIDAKRLSSTPKQ